MHAHTHVCVHYKYACTRSRRYIRHMLASIDQRVNPLQSMPLLTLCPPHASAGGDVRWGGGDYHSLQDRTPLLAALRLGLTCTQGK